MRQVRVLSAEKKKLDIQNFFFFLIDDANCSLLRLIAKQQQGTSELGFVPNITFYTGKRNKSARFWKGLKLVV